jgi:iron(III) transport system substrate-binding protein
MGSAFFRKAVLAFCLLPASCAFPEAVFCFEVPRNYPRSYSRLVEASAAEGKLVVYSAADTFDVAALARDFNTLHPRIRVEHQNLHTAELYRRFVRETASGERSADLLISSAMDLQTKLVNDGYAQPYASPEKPYLPTWAVWKNEAYGVAAEPVVFVYDRRVLRGSDIPTTRGELELLLARRADVMRGKVALYDPALSGAGFLYLTQDLKASRDTTDLLSAIGRTRPVLSTSGAAIVRDISAGKIVLAYNMNGAYALERQAQDPAIGVVFPRDYTLVMARIAFIARDARQPAAARLFLDYMLSPRGQSLLAGLKMTPVRRDIAMAGPKPVAESLRAIHIGPALLANLDQMKRQRLLKEIGSALADGS